jgi:hypothetical protein
MAIETAGKTFIWGDDYVALSDEGEAYLINPLIPASGQANFYGKPKTAKSFAALGVAIAVSSEMKEWLGFPVEQHGPVLYVQLDTPRAEWKRRMRKVAKAGFDISKIAMLDLKIVPYPFNIADRQHQAWLRQQVEAVKPILVVIDTLREAHDGEENDSTDMKRAVAAIVAAAAGAAIIYVSHSRKDSAFNAMGAESDLMDEGRGSSYVSGRMDTIVRFTGKKGKGHMAFKGRAVSEGKVPIVQDGLDDINGPGTGLVELDGDHTKQEQAVLRMLKEHGDWTRHKMAKALFNQGVFGSTKTAERWIEKLSGLAEDEPKAA